MVECDGLQRRQALGTLGRREGSVVMKVKKAVIPAAGQGTRFLPATKAIPKEMIPIVDVPMIQWIVLEAVHSGIEEIVLVTARGKDAIADHFDFHPELEESLEKKGKPELAKISRDIGKLCNLITVRQKTPMGLGHAVACAEHVIGSDPFAILLGDDLIDHTTPCTRQLVEFAEFQKGNVVGVMEVPLPEVSKYGMVGGKQLSDRLMQVDRLIEKPEPSQTPSQWAIPGRYVLTATIFDCIRETPPGRGGEIQLTDALQRLASKEPLFAYRFDGRRYDTGDRLGFIDATIAFALKRPELREGVKSILQQYQGIL